MVSIPVMDTSPKGAGENGFLTLALYRLRLTCPKKRVLPSAVANFYMEPILLKMRRSTGHEGINLDHSA